MNIKATITPNLSGNPISIQTLDRKQPMKEKLHYCLATATVFWACLISPAQAAVVLPPIFGTNMVVQKDEPLNFWGWADAGEKITIKQGGAVVATAVGEGKEKPWRAKLPAQKQGAVADIEVAGSNTITLKNILAGEVWLCTGQSNMVMTLLKGYTPVLNGEAEAAAATDEQIRFYQGGGNNSTPPKMTSEAKESWAVCSPESAARFSAVGYFFAKKLRSERKVPVGLICLAAGGRPAEWFAPERVMEKDTEFQAQKAEALALKAKLGAKADADKKAGGEYRKLAMEAKSKHEKAPPQPPNQLTPEEAAKMSAAQVYLDFGFLYRRDMQALNPVPLAGFIWYQGESNATRGEQYAGLMTKIIQGWREDWGGKPLPLIMVALAGYECGEKEPTAMTAKGVSWPLVREAMLKVAATVPNTGVVSAVDVGDPTNIHPANKKPVGERAGLWALNHVYGQKVVCEGPGFGKVAFSAGKAVVPLATNKEGVVLKSPGGFELAGEDRKFVPAKAELKGETLEVTAPEVSKPVALRYAFLNFPECTLYNGAGLPAMPFRTDDWPLVPSAAPAGPSKK